MRVQPQQKRFEVAVSAGGPQHLGQRTGAGVSHVLQVPRVRDVLAPQLGLSAQHMLGLVGRQGCRDGFILIDPFQRQEAADGQRLRFARALVVIKIRVRRRRHDHVVAGLRGGDPALLAPPAHDHRAGRQPAFQDLVPAHQPPAIGGQKGVDLLGKPGLQFRLVLQALRADQLLDLRAGFPLRLDRLVAPDVNIAAGKQGHHFAQHLLAELDRPRPRRENVLADSPPRPGADFLLLVGKHTQLRVRGNRRPGMAGHLDLGHDRDVPLGGITDQLADVVLRVKATVTPAVELPRLVAVVSDQRLVAPSADLGQPRVLLDFDPPALVVGQVHLQAVEFVLGHHVDKPQHVVLGQEVPRRVDQQPAPREPRPVGDAKARKAAGLALDWLRGGKELGREQLAQGLDGVEQSRRFGRPEFDPLRADLQLVAFRAKLAVQGVVQLQRDARRLGGAGFRQLQFAAQAGCQGVDQLAGLRSGRSASPNLGVGRECKAAWVRLQRNRRGDQGHLCGLQGPCFPTAHAGQACQAPHDQSKPTRHRFVPF